VGRASNLLFDDDGYRGAVVSTAGLHMLVREGNTLTVGAGVPLTAAARAALDASLTGLEFAYGIPGSCGGAVYMNAGAYGGEISQCLLFSRAYHVPSGEIRKLCAEEHRFGYRTGVYREHPEWIILSAQVRLAPGDAEAIRAAMDDHMRSRAEKQPLEYPSAGSVFKRYPGRYTAQMIDEAGLKGRRIGGAEVSEKHAGFIVNRGGASSADVLALIEEIRRTLAARYGVDIETEVIYIPPDGEGIVRERDGQ
jgi:UDP-N-acetylmuramate dehydrogenase